MKASIISLILFLFFTEGVAQNRFNKLYRFDSLQYNSVRFHGMRIVDSSIFTVGVGVVKDSIYLTNPGIFTRLNMQGDVKFNKYLGRFPVSTEAWADGILPISKNKFLVTGHNWDSSFSAIMLNNDGETIFKKQYNPLTNRSQYRLPYSLTQITNNLFALLINDVVLSTSKPQIILVDSFGNKVNLLKIESGWNLTGHLQVILNKAKNLDVMIYSEVGDFQSVAFKYVTQLYELDTIGNVLWRYQTPTNRYIYGDGFVQLANSNYLMWGYEEYSRPDAVNRYRLLDSIKTYICEIKPNVGVVWEKHYGHHLSQTFDLKILKDSSIVFVGQYMANSTINFYQTGYLFKLNKNRDSIYRRNLVHPIFSHGMADYFPEKIEELDNGDLVIAGFAQDKKQSSLTRGQWGWLIRTDSMGCSLESTCRVPTKEVENAPLSINVFPNPTSGSFTVDLKDDLQNQNTVFKLYNTVGQLVMNRKLDNTANKIEFDVSHLIEGFYIFTLNTESGQMVGNGKLQIRR